MKNFASSLPLLEVIKAQKLGKSNGIYSICSANPLVLEAGMKQAAQDTSNLLIESTSNQVNQFGGYTGMSPLHFAQFVAKIANKVHFPANRIILGCDHLGPNPWQKESASIAMEKSRQLVLDSVLAGYTKIHIDTSISCGDDPTGSLNNEICAIRTADLCAIAENEANKENLPVYIIGTEVPIPGGEVGESKSPQVTKPEEAYQAIELFHKTFVSRGLESAWERVIGLVVQPGVDFGDDMIFEYNREVAKPLSQMIETIPNIVFEAHSTDYQHPIHLRQMVEDHFAILKVGPALTFAMREAIFALAQLENELLRGKNSGLIETAERLMLAEPKYWLSYYHGNQDQQAYSRIFSLCDRIRYYWPHPELQSSLQQMIQNLSQKPIPLSLMYQYLPDLYPLIHEGVISNNPKSIIRANICRVTGQYSSACRG